MKRLIFLCCCSLLLTGCWDVKEPERLMYIFGLGIDYKDEEYIVYATIASIISIVIYMIRKNVSDKNIDNELDD